MASCQSVILDVKLYYCDRSDQETCPLTGIWRLSAPQRLVMYLSFNPCHGVWPLSGKVRYEKFHSMCILMYIHRYVSIDMYVHMQVIYADLEVPIY